MPKIMLSIRHNWCEKILPGEDGVPGGKTLDIRKTKPDCDYPCEVYLCEADGSGEGLVVGVFTMTGVVEIEEYTEQVGVQSCLSAEEFAAYADGKLVYGWKISDPKRLSKPISVRKYGFVSPPLSPSWAYIENNAPAISEETSKDKTDAKSASGTTGLLTWTSTQQLEGRTVADNSSNPGEQASHATTQSDIYGVCRFCGQIRYFQDAGIGKAQRDDFVTMECHCSTGEEYRKKQEWEHRIQKEIDRAEIRIEELFNAGAERAGKTPADADQLVLLLDLAERVIRCGIKSAAIELTDGVKAKISRTRQNVTVIARTDTDSIKAEV